MVRTAANGCSACDKCQSKPEEWISLENVRTLTRNIAVINKMKEEFQKPVEVMVWVEALVRNNCKRWVGTERCTVALIATLNVVRGVTGMTGDVPNPPEPPRNIFGKIEIFANLKFSGSFSAIYKILKKPYEILAIFKKNEKMCCRNFHFDQLFSKTFLKFQKCVLFSNGCHFMSSWPISMPRGKENSLTGSSDWFPMELGRFRQPLRR